jgi:hypothetical protein
LFQFFEGCLSYCTTFKPKKLYPILLIVGLEVIYIEDNQTI